MRRRTPNKSLVNLRWDPKPESSNEFSRIEPSTNQTIRLFQSRPRAFPEESESHQEQCPEREEVSTNDDQAAKNPSHLSKAFGVQNSTLELLLSIRKIKFVLLQPSRGNAPIHSLRRPLHIRELQLHVRILVLGDVPATQNFHINLPWAFVLPNPRRSSSHISLSLFNNSFLSCPPSSFLPHHQKDREQNKLSLSLVAVTTST